MGETSVRDSWETYSSRRWKANIESPPDALDNKVEHMWGVSYDLKDSGKHEIGVIAEEVGAVVPEAVSYEANGRDASGVDCNRLIALLIEAAKQQHKEIGVAVESVVDPFRHPLDPRIRNFSGDPCQCSIRFCLQDRTRAKLRFPSGCMAS